MALSSFSFIILSLLYLILPILLGSHILFINYFTKMYFLNAFGSRDKYGSEIHWLEGIILLKNIILHLPFDC